MMLSRLKSMWVNRSSLLSQPKWNSFESKGIDQQIFSVTFTAYITVTIKINANVAFKTIDEKV